MSRALLLAVLLAVLGLGQAGAGISDDFDQRIDQGLELLYQGDYDSALAVFDSFIRDHPRNPAGYFFKAGLHQTRMSAFESDCWLKDYRAAADSVMLLCDLALAGDSRDAWALFFRGGARSYDAAWEARQGRYLAAFRNGMTAVSDFRQAREADSSLYDAGIGIGSYHYFRTKATSLLKWLPFIGDNREKGISEIVLAIERGRYSRVMGQNALLWIYTDYGRDRKALALGLELEQRYPRNPFFHWAVPELLWRQKRWPEAERAYGKLLEMLDRQANLNNYNRVVASYKLSRCLLENGRYRQAEEMARRAINYPLDRESAKRLVTERRRAQEIMEKAARSAGEGRL